MLWRAGLWLAVALAGCAAAEANNGGGIYSSTGRFIKLYDVEKSLVDVLQVRVMMYSLRLTLFLNLLTSRQALDSCDAVARQTRRA